MTARAAEHAYAADRFAREIVGFLKVVGGALAAADRQPVGRASLEGGVKERAGSTLRRMPGRSAPFSSGQMPRVAVACLVARHVRSYGRCLAWSIHASAFGTFGHMADASRGGRMPRRSTGLAVRQVLIAG